MKKIRFGVFEFDEKDGLRFECSICKAWTNIYAFGSRVCKKCLPQHEEKHSGIALAMEADRKSWTEAKKKMSVEARYGVGKKDSEVYKDILGMGDDKGDEGVFD